MGGKTSSASKNKYIQKAYDRINFVMPKGRKAEIQECAQREGISASEWINAAIVEKMNGEAMQETAACAMAIEGTCASIPDLEAYARSAHMTPDEYILTAVREKMDRQDEKTPEEMEHEKVSD